MDFNPESYEIIDAHIHPSANDIPGSDITPFGVATDASSMFATLRSVGIRMACGSLLRTHDWESLTFKDIQRLNEAMLRIRDQYPDFYIPGIIVQPKFPE